MDKKRKWDQPGEEGDSSVKAPKTDENSKSATAAAAAAAIAAKIAAQFAGPSGSSAPGVSGPKDPHDGDFTKDIEINDVRNRYLLTKGATQQQIQQETGASVTTKGVWYPDKSKATDKDPPLYLHVSGSTQAMVDAAVDMINERIAQDLGSLVEDRRRDDKPRERRKWPEEKLPVGLDTIRNFNVRAKVVGPQGAFVKYIQSETNTRVQIKGIGSGFYEAETNRESDEPMHIHITGPDEGQVARAKELTEDLLLVVRQEHAKARQAMMEQQMQLQQAQAQYAAYSAYNGYAPPPPSDAAPPPPPSDAPPPPPPEEGAPPPPDGAPPAQGAAMTAAGAGAPGSQQSAADYAAYWAAYGYDVNSEAFKEWQAQTQQQYAAYYAAQGYSVGTTSDATSATPSAPTGAPAGEALPPPPPPPSNDAPPPPPPAA